MNAQFFDRYFFLHKVSNFCSCKIKIVQPQRSNQMPIINNVFYVYWLTAKCHSLHAIKLKKL